MICYGIVPVSYLPSFRQVLTFSCDTFLGKAILLLDLGKNDALAF